MNDSFKSLIGKMSDATKAKLKESFSYLDKSYTYLAYVFVTNILTKGLKNANKSRLGNSHLTVEQLINDFKNFAVEEFGSLAKITLNEMGIFSLCDLRKIILSLNECGIIQLADKDNLDSLITRGFDFSDSFQKIKEVDESSFIEYPKIDMM